MIPINCTVHLKIYAGIQMLWSNWKMKRWSNYKYRRLDQWMEKWGDERISSMKRAYKEFLSAPTWKLHNETVSEKTKYEFFFIVQLLLLTCIADYNIHLVSIGVFFLSNTALYTRIIRRSLSSAKSCRCRTAPALMWINRKTSVFIYIDYSLALRSSFIWPAITHYETGDPTRNILNISNDTVIGRGEDCWVLPVPIDFVRNQLGSPDPS